MDRRGFFRRLLGLGAGAALASNVRAEEPPTYFVPDPSYPPGHPGPIPGVRVSAARISECQRRMGESLAAMERLSSVVVRPL